MMFKNLKKPKIPLCPNCREELERYGDEDNYRKRERKVIWICRNCGYRRNEYKKLK